MIIFLVVSLLEQQTAFYKSENKQFIWERLRFFFGGGVKGAHFNRIYSETFTGPLKAKPLLSCNK